MGLIVIGCAFLYLLWTSFSASFHFALTPSEFLASRAEFAAKTVKLAGTVESGSVHVAGQDYFFKIADDKKGELPVHYRGIVPNTFREEAEIVVTGKLGPDENTFEATQILTKCASKYKSR